MGYHLNDRECHGRTMPVIESSNEKEDISPKVELKTSSSVLHLKRSLKEPKHSQECFRL